MRIPRVLQDRLMAFVMIRTERQCQFIDGNPIEYEKRYRIVEDLICRPYRDWRARVWACGPTAVITAA
ncbi:MAG: hypothetical protein ABL921_29660 [Pirellula sp.]